ncbi:hypothetical protein B0I37DRAFT_90346 [Chaetomium sp. MPI-CAGE-AT-0009]|nr:hypothetical protein B0I37DRAFT_90346 [Chaetomium sp. MPI-CAGE-AT-0009]
MLADTTFLLDTVINLPPNPPQAQLHKVLAMSNWLRGRLSAAAAAAAAATTTTPTITITTPTDLATTNTTIHTNTNTNINPNINTSINTTTTPPANKNTALHRAILLSSQLYCHAIQTRQPLARVAQAQDALALVEAVRAVPGEVWEGGIGAGGGGGGGGGGSSSSGGGGGSGSGGGGDSGGRMLGTLVSVLASVLPVMVGGGFDAVVEDPSGGDGYGYGYDGHDGYGHDGYGYGYGGRGLVVAAVVRLAVVDWEGAVRVLGRVARLQAWLRGVGGG